MSFSSGDVLNSRYRLVEKIGEGGMGMVWRAERLEDNTDCAIKILSAALVDDVRSIERFHLEARAAMVIHHPNVCPVLDVGEIDGLPYLVMPRLVGMNVGARLMMEGPFRTRDALQIIVQVLDALEAAHASGILHRDLKPENVFLEQSEQEVPHVRVLDFGVAKFIGDDAERVKLTRTGALIGTPAYMSPEQASGFDDVDQRADIWAMGVLLFEMLTRELPFVGTNYNAMLLAIATRAPRSLRGLCPSLDLHVRKIVERALERDRSRRFQSAREMADVIRAWLDGRAHPALEDLSKEPDRYDPDPSLVTLSGSRNERFPNWFVPALSVVLIAGAAIGLWVVKARATASNSVGSNTTSTNVPSTLLLDAAVADVPLVQNTTSLDVAVVSPWVSVNVRDLPSNASVLVNDAGSTLPVRVPRGETVVVTVHAAGMEDWSQTIVAQGDLLLVYQARQRSLEDASVMDARTEDARVRAVRPTHSTEPRPRRDGGSLEPDPGI